MEKQGVFYAVSVGPGDPELLTRQACRVLADCPVVAAPRMKSGRMLALDIAAGAVDTQGKTILPLDFSMERSEAVREDSYRTAAAAIEAELSAGRDVANALPLPRTKVVMKSGKAIYKAAAALERHGLLANAGMVADCGLETEQVYTDLRQLPEEISYFATIVAD